MWYIRCSYGNIRKICGRTQNGKIIVPDRLYTNWLTGYAYFIEWTDDPLELKQQIEIAIQKSTQKHFIDNSQEKMKRNLT